MHGQVRLGEDDVLVAAVAVVDDWGTGRGSRPVQRSRRVSVHFRLPGHLQQLAARFRVLLGGLLRGHHLALGRGLDLRPPGARAEDLHQVVDEVLLGTVAGTFLVQVSLYVGFEVCTHTQTTTTLTQHGKSATVRRTAVATTETIRQQRPESSVRTIYRDKTATTWITW